MKKVLPWIAVVIVATSCTSTTNSATDTSPASDAQAVEQGYVALCNDGDYSDNLDTKATCSGGDGVDHWLATYGECEDGQIVELATEDCGFSNDLERLAPVGYKPTPTTSMTTTSMGGTGQSSPTSTDLEMLNALTVEAEHARVGYDRDLFPHWSDADGDGCDVRCEVLDAQVLPQGGWFSEWDGATEPSDTEVHIDHVIALAEAWDSGADTWPPARRSEFANDRPNLLAVTASSNLRKSDKDAAEWFPSRAEANCLWARTSITVKTKWALSVDPPEKAALKNLLAGCTAPTTTAPTASTAPPTSSPPTSSTPPQSSPPAPSTVTPGAFCSGAGSTGVSSGGVPMTCSAQKCTGEPYQQPRWRKTNC